MTKPKCDVCGSTLVPCDCHPIKLPEEKYKDADGNVVTLRWLVLNEPEWAINTIRRLRKDLAELKDKIEKMEQTLQ